MNKPEPVPVSQIAISIGVAIMVVVAFFFALTAGIKAFNRYQARADAANQVSVTHTLIQKEAQQVEVQKQTANVKIAEAHGIRRSQNLIDDTLTPLYVQHEAIQAQLAMANSPNHTEIYIPSGSNGVPLVNDIGPAGTEAASK